MDWLREHPDLVKVAGVVVTLLSVVSVVGLPILVARIPADYFAQIRAPASPWAHHHPVWRTLLHGLRAVVGIVLLVLGIGMLFLPGQGVLTILMAVLLLEFPGKRRMELWIVRRPRVLAALNWIRRKAGRAPLRVLVAEETT